VGTFFGLGVEDKKTDFCEISILTLAIYFGGVGRKGKYTDNKQEALIN
jgi:hypothetical protein